MKHDEFGIRPLTATIRDRETERAFLDARRADDARATALALLLGGLAYAMAGLTDAAVFADAVPGTLLQVRLLRALGVALCLGSGLLVWRLRTTRAVHALSVLAMLGTLGTYSVIAFWEETLVGASDFRLVFSVFSLLAFIFFPIRVVYSAAMALWMMANVSLLFCRHRAQRRGGTPAHARADGDVRGGRRVVFHHQPSKSPQGVRPAAAERAGVGGGVSRGRAAARRRARARSAPAEPRANGGRANRRTAQEPARSGRLSANGSHWTVGRRARARLQQPVGGRHRQCGARPPRRGAARGGPCVPARDPRRGEARVGAVARLAHVQPAPGDGVPAGRPGRARRPYDRPVADGGRDRRPRRRESRR